MATLRELAKYTGFSITTISRVLNSDPTMSVSDATREVILKAAGDLHYKNVPGRFRVGNAPALRFGFAEMLSPAEQLADPYYLYLKNYAEQHCRDLGYGVTVLCERAGSYERTSAEKLSGVLAIGIFSDEQVLQLSGLSGHIVFLDSSPDELHYDSVVLNFRLGVEQAAESLIALGHRRLGFLGPVCKLDQRKRPAPEIRRQIFIHYLQKKGLFDERFLFDAPMDASGARTVLSERIASGAPLPTALLAANEEAAIGALNAAKAAGLRVPEDLSIISFNDTPLGALTDPPLSGVCTHVEAMSAAAVDLLARRCLGQETAVPLKIVVPPALVLRESVCTARRDLENLEADKC